MSKPLIAIPGRMSPEATGHRTPVTSCGQNYIDAIHRAGGLPIIVPPTDDMSMIAETIASEYEINWDEWNDEETVRMQKEITDGLEFYMSKFHFLLDQDDELNEEAEDALMDALDNILSGYILQTLVNRKNAIDELLLIV